MRAKATISVALLCSRSRSIGDLASGRLGCDDPQMPCISVG